MILVGIDEYLRGSETFFLTLISKALLNDNSVALFHIFTVCVFFSFSFFFLMATPMAYGSSQARDHLGLHHSHRNAGSEQRLQPTTQLRVTPDP